eukprot:358591_1
MVYTFTSAGACWSSSAPTTSQQTSIPTTAIPTTNQPSTPIPTTAMPTTNNPTTHSPTTFSPTTTSPTTFTPTTTSPTTTFPTTATTWCALFVYSDPNRGGISWPSGAGFDVAECINTVGNFVNDYLSSAYLESKSSYTCTAI